MSKTGDGMEKAASGKKFPKRPDKHSCESRLYRKLKAVIKKSWCRDEQIVGILHALAAELQQNIQRDQPLIKYWRQYYRQFGQGKENHR